MPLRAAHQAALHRAWLYGDEPCAAATAWTQVATLRRTRVTHPHFFHEAFADACASEDPHLVLAVQTIALDHAERCQRLAADRAARIAHEIRIAAGLSVPS